MAKTGIKWIDDILPGSTQDFFFKVGDMARFSMRFFVEIIKPPYETKEFFKQCYQIGYKSIGLVGITGFIIGLTLTIQSIPSLAKFGAEMMVPSMVALAVFLEIGPVITGLIFAGKIGSSIGAELGSMKVSEQIDAMEISGTNPYNYLVVTRVAASALMLPLLVFYADFIALIGGFVAVNTIGGGMPFPIFIRESFSSVDFMTIIPSSIKTFFFGFAVGMIGCYEGYNADRGTESVGIAANTAVVVSSLAIIIIDMINVQITSLLS